MVGACIELPVSGGELQRYELGPPRELPPARPPFAREALAAGHVVADPLADIDPWLDAAIDWEQTIAYR